jgi:hypothetical protein
MTSTSSLCEPDKLSGAPNSGRCHICRRQAAVTPVSCPALDDLPDLDAIDAIEDIRIIQREWRLCASCAQAVGREVERVALDSPLRVATAIALVACVRDPQASPAIWRARYWERMDAATQDKLARRAVILFFAWPVIVLMSAVALTAALN